MESNQYAIHEKSKIIVEHFHTEVISKGKVGGKARAMVISSSIKRAIEYYKEISKLLEERKSPFKAIVAFSGTSEYEGKQVTEADLNGFPSAKIEKTFKADPSQTTLPWWESFCFGMLDLSKRQGLVIYIR